MGCDIHMHVEFKSNRHWSGKKDWMCGDHFHSIDPTDSRYVIQHVGLLEDRCYSLFSVLANVRNGRDLPYISDPKGLPNDVTKYVEEDYDSWGCDAHSCSYLTLREIFEFNEKVEPKNEFGGYILEPLIDRMFQRADELNVLYDFELKHPITDDVRKKMENIRIVFWFDN